MSRSQYDNMRYTDHNEIMNLIGLRNLQKQFFEDEVMIWCQQLEKGPLAEYDNQFQFIEIPLTVANSRTLIPCNTIRILDVYTIPGDQSSRVPFTSNGEYLFFHPTEFTGESVYIDYLGTPISEDGIPLIVRGHEFACVAFCIYNKYYGDMIADKLSGATRQQIISEKDSEIVAAIANRGYRYRTRGSSVNGSIIRGDRIYKIGNMPLHTKKLPG